MKIKAFLFSAVFMSFISFAFGETSGYLSFDYVKSQEEGVFSEGTFHNVRLGIVFSGEIIPEIGYLSEVRFEEGFSIEMEQAWIAFRPSHAFNLKLGLYLVPFGKYNQSNRAHQTLLINSPLSVENFYPFQWSDMGVLLEGKFNRIFYSAYLGNGLSEEEWLSSGEQFQDNNADKGKGGRIGLFLSQGFEIGYSYYKGKFDDENNRNLTLRGGDLTWELGGLQILSEYTWVEAENPESFSNGDGKGYFVQLSFPIKNFRPFLNYQYLKYEDLFHGRGFLDHYNKGEGISLEKSRWALGVVFIVSDSVFLKLEYDINEEENKELKDNSLSIQAALGF